MGSALGAVVTFGSTVLLLQADQGIAGVLVGAAVGMAVAAAIMLPAAVASHAGPLERPAGDRDPQWSLPLGGRRFLGYVAPFGGIAVLNYVVHSQTEMFFLTHFHGAALAGYFQLGFLVSQRLIDFVPLALWEVSMAGFSRIAVREPERLPQALRAYLTLLYLVIAPLACLGVAFSESVIGVLYEPDMLPATLVSRAYFVMAAIAAFGAPVGMIVYARERVGAALRAYALFALVNVALDLALIPPLGLWGAVLGLGLAKILAVLLISRLAWQEVPSLTVPWAFIARAFVASSPVLLWMTVETRWTQPWQVVAGMAGACLLLVVSFRGMRVIGAGERHLIAGTRLPLRDKLLAVLSGGRETMA
jgi:O-antigen/teichoic acid export membrane protein